MGWSPRSTETHNTSQFSARTVPIGGVVLHHGATTSADAIIAMETSGSRQVSSHQVIKDARNAGVVQEQFRAWSLSSSTWDSWALTVECANESTDGWTISAASEETLAQQVADWASRYGFYPQRNGDPSSWTVLGHREVYSIHGASYATACPGGMNLDGITRRAQQILAGENPEEEEGTMQYIWCKEFKDSPRYALLDPTIENGAWETLVPAEATQMSWLTWSKATQGAPLLVNATMYLEKIKAAKAVYDRRAKIGASASGSGSVVIDYDKLAKALAGIVPTAEQNGAAARTAIVK
jgi:hypothetical protein